MASVIRCRKVQVLEVGIQADVNFWGFCLSRDFQVMVVIAYILSDVVFLMGCSLIVFVMVIHDLDDLGKPRSPHDFGKLHTAAKLCTMGPTSETVIYGNPSM